VKPQIKRMDNKLRKLVQDRDKICQKCSHDGSFYPLEVHHAYKRDKFGTRWMIAACILLCKKCHNWAEVHPKDFKEWWLDRVGEEKAEIMRLESERLKVDLDEIERGLRYE